MRPLPDERGQDHSTSQVKDEDERACPNQGLERAGKCPGHDSQLMADSENPDDPQHPQEPEEGQEVQGLAGHHSRQEKGQAEVHDPGRHREHVERTPRIPPVAADAKVARAKEYLQRVEQDEEVLQDRVCSWLRRRYASTQVDVLVDGFVELLLDANLDGSISLQALLHADLDLLRLRHIHAQEAQVLIEAVGAWGGCAQEA
mmetsp:Transcript_101101/g.294370  ORF Transcript_101101/g.294370 Transcript_101101/m.294370 type:complete len:202 (-) Transcript_101101:337-942(-)